MDKYNVYSVAAEVLLFVTWVAIVAFCMTTVVLPFIQSAFGD
jgi:hypothetical protein